MENHLIFICGVYRSASTWSFNVVREYALSRNWSIEQLADNRVSALAPADVRILKFHHDPNGEALNFLKAGQAKCVVTLRSPKDSIRSMMQTFGKPFEEALQDVKSSFEFASSVKAYALMLNYETITQRSVSSTLRILLHVYGLTALLKSRSIYQKTNRKALFREAQQVANHKGNLDHIEDLGFTYYDKRTFLHRRHVNLTDVKAEQYLSKAQISLIEESFAPFSAELGSR